MATALPILLLGGAALLMMGGKKKTKPTHDDDDDLEDDLEEEEDSDDVVEEPQVSQLLVGPSQAQKCSAFIEAVWTEPGEGEAAIKSLVIEETVLPEMQAAAKQKRKEKGEDLTSGFSNTLVMIGFNMIAPDCGWVLTGDGWRYADNQPFEGKILDVYEGLNQVALSVVEWANTPQKAGLAEAVAPLPDPQPEEPGGLKFDMGG